MLQRLQIKAGAVIRDVITGERVKTLTEPLMINGHIRRHLHAWLFVYSLRACEVKLADAEIVGEDRIDRNQSISVGTLIDSAKLLKSEDGENSEYDRALVELIADVLGTDNYGLVTKEIDIKTFQ